MGTIFLISNANKSVHASQTPNLVIFQQEFVTGDAVNHKNFYFDQKVTLTNQLTFSPFDQGGVYSAEFLKRRRETIFRWSLDKAGKSGVFRSFLPDVTEWEAIADHGVDFLGKINYDGLVDAVFGTAWVRYLIKMLTIIGYIGSTYSTYQLILQIYRRFTGRGRRRRHRARGRGYRMADYYDYGPPGYGEV